MGNIGRVTKDGLAVLGFLLRYNVRCGAMLYLSVCDAVLIFLEITDGGCCGGVVNGGGVMRGGVRGGLLE